MAKLNKREQKVLAYLEERARIQAQEYMNAYDRHDVEEPWYLGHAAEAVAIKSAVRDIFDGRVS